MQNHCFASNSFQQPLNINCRIEYPFLDKERTRENVESIASKRLFEKYSIQIIYNQADVSPLVHTTSLCIYLWIGFSGMHTHNRYILERSL